MKKIIRLTESDLALIVRRVINEQGEREFKEPADPKETKLSFQDCFDNVSDGFNVPPVCFGSKIYDCKKKLVGMNPKFPNDEKRVFACIDEKLKKVQGSLDYLKNMK